MNRSVVVFGSLLVLVLASGCSSNKEEKVSAEQCDWLFKVKKELVAGQCVHINNHLYMVTAVGKDAYGLVLDADHSKFWTMPKVDTHNRGIESECNGDLRKVSDEYLKGNK